MLYEGVATAGGSAGAHAAAVDFVCTVMDSMPVEGNEILVFSLVYLALIITLSITFVDVAAKQLWPTKLLDPAVAKRVAAIRARFPKLPKNTSDQNDTEAAKSVCTVQTYDGVVSQEAYVAGLSVDEDLIPVLANNSAYDTVSGYCASTTRGYAMLSTVLIAAVITLGYLWVHNAQVDKSAASSAGKIALLGYALLSLTGIVMITPSRDAVYRNANICLFSNVPYKLGKVANPTMKLHYVGILSFILLPMLAHGYTALKAGPAMPNYKGALFGCACQIISAVLFGLSIALSGKAFSKLMGKKLKILTEIICVLSSFLAYLQYETYATAACASQVALYNTLLLAAAFLPFVLVSRHYLCTPTSFATEPSVVLMDGSTPVACSGPPPVMGFDQDPTPLPQA